MGDWVVLYDRGDNSDEGRLKVSWGQNGEVEPDGEETMLTYSPDSAKD